MDRTFLLAGAVAGLIAVGFGAFGAHGLRGRLTPEMLAVTGVTVLGAITPIGGVAFLAGWASLIVAAL